MHRKCQTWREFESRSKTVIACNGTVVQNAWHVRRDRALFLNEQAVELFEARALDANSTVSRASMMTHPRCSQRRPRSWRRPLTTYSINRPNTCWDKRGRKSSDSTAAKKVTRMKSWCMKLFRNPSDDEKLIVVYWTDYRYVLFISTVLFIILFLSLFTFLSVQILCM